jgi:cullin 1
MYDLTMKIPDGLNELKKILEAHIYNKGMEAIEKCSEAALNVNFFYYGSEIYGFLKFSYQLKDPKIYVQTILDVHKKYDHLVLSSFHNDKGFVAALDKACGKFINNNAITRATNSLSKSPELLARYCDFLLKKR